MADSGQRVSSLILEGIDDGVDPVGPTGERDPDSSLVARIKYLGRAISATLRAGAIRLIVGCQRIGHVSNCPR